VSETEKRSLWCEQLYENRAAALILYGRALGLTHPEAEDVLHDTFVAMMGLETPPADPEQFAVRAYRNRAINHRRSFWRRLKRENAAVLWFDQSDNQSEAELLAVNALAALPPNQREVVVLKIWHELTFEAIATITNTSPNTAAARYRYGIEKIRKAISRTSQETTHEQPHPIGTVAPFLETARPIPGA
ncbi:MAG: sigma-70 family RNA polymerase sigma factor, partial [Verrucomicrobiota bacterium]|nr:sigma-70 family RNA polymerase sigma factor [Verrucomicrobiota bacterium]